MLKRILRTLRGLLPGGRDAAGGPPAAEAQLLEALREEHRRTREQAHGEVGAVLGETEAATACYRDAARLAAEAANRRTVGERPPAAAQLAVREVEAAEVLSGAGAPSS